MKAAREFPLRARERLTFEYVLLDEVNDAPEHAREVVEAGAGNAGEGQFDCAQRRVRVTVSHAGCGAGGGFSEDSDVGRDTGVCAASARAGYFCSLRAVKGDGGDSRGDVICEFLASNPHER